MRRSRLMTAVAAVVLVASACSGAGSGSATKAVTLNTLNGSGVSGTATLTDAGGGKTTVDVTVNGATADYADMPAHIHPGTCSTLDPKPKYPLNNIKSGKSTTTIDVALADLTKSPFAVNLHHSAADATTYSACGDIK